MRHHFVPRWLQLQRNDAEVEWEAEWEWESGREIDWPWKETNQRFRKKDVEFWKDLSCPSEKELRRLDFGERWPGPLGFQIMDKRLFLRKIHFENIPRTLRNVKAG